MCIYTFVRGEDVKKNIKNISILKNVISEVEEHKGIFLEDFNEGTFSDKIVLSNCRRDSSKSENRIGKLFNGSRVKLSPSKDKAGLEIQVSRVDFNASIINFENCVEMIKENKEKGWFIGLGIDGPEYYSIEKLTHGIITGSTGFGKSSLFKSLLTQTLSFHDKIVNFIIDPKKVDFPLFEKHPNVSKVAYDFAGWSSILNSMLVELSQREEIFNQSFENPPSQLSDYWKIREEEGLDYLPELPRIIIWIDEYHNVKQNMSSTISSNEIIEFLARKGRSFGIHLMMSSQRNADFNSTINDQASSSFYFYSNSNTSYIAHDLLARERGGPKPVVGLTNFISENEFGEEVLVSALVPFIDTQTALNISYSLCDRTEKREYGGLSGVETTIEVMSDGKIMLELVAGKGLSLASSEGSARRYGSSGNFIHSYPDLFIDQKLMVTEEESVVEAVSVSNKDKKDEAVDEQVDDVFDELLKILDQEHSEKNKKDDPLKNKNSNKSDSDEEVKKVSFSYEKYPIFDNSHKLVSKEEYLDTLESYSQEDFARFIAPVGSNPMVNVFRDYYLSGDEKREIVIGFDELCLSENDSESVERYIEESLISIKNNRSIPMLIISGENGMGKETVCNAVKDEIIRRFSIPKDSSTKKSHKKSCEEAVYFPYEFKVFESQEDAIKHNRMKNNNEGVILLQRSHQKQKGGVEQNTFASLSEYHIYIELSEKDYAEKKILTSLIALLLEKNAFEGEVDQSLINEFINSGVKSIPNNINTIIMRSSQNAFHANDVFNMTHLKKNLNDFKVNSFFESCPYAKVISPTKTRADIYLNEENSGMIDSIITRIETFSSLKYKFLEKINRVSRMVALFTGLPGTGKSMAAEVIAHETKKDIWYLNFGELQSPYVGETEQILNSVFDMSENANAILLLDECDTLLSNRAESSQYHRKISNHLLNLIENFKGSLILTTNNPHLIDKAFARRCDVKIEFQLPDSSSCASILKNLLEPDAPLEEGFSYLNVLEGLSLSGGNLRLAVERAVMKMCSENKDILTEELVRKSILEIINENDLFDQKTTRISLA